MSQDGGNDEEQDPVTPKGKSGRKPLEFTASPFKPAGGSVQDMLGGSHQGNDREMIAALKHDNELMERNLATAFSIQGMNKLKNTLRHFQNVQRDADDWMASVDMEPRETDPKSVSDLKVQPMHHITP